MKIPLGQTQKPAAGSPKPAAGYPALFASYLHPLWPRVLLMAAFLLGGIGLRLVNPQILRYFIDTARGSGQVSAVTDAALLFIGIVVLQQVFSVLDAYFSETVAWTSTNALRHDLAAHCLDQLFADIES